MSAYQSLCSIFFIISLNAASLSLNGFQSEGFSASKGVDDVDTGIGCVDTDSLLLRTFTGNNLVLFHNIEVNRKKRVFKSFLVLCHDHSKKK